MFTLVAATLDPMGATASIQFYKKNKIGYTKKKMVDDDAEKSTISHTASRARNNACTTKEKT